MPRRKKSDEGIMDITPYAEQRIWAYQKRRYPVLCPAMAV